MKFAGPSMGAALGSGLMGGIASAQELMTKEELARDTSAMATYAKLVNSGEWEPVGKEGVNDGGVLRVGNVGFLKKAAGGGMDWKAANYMSQIKRREDLTRLGEKQFEWQKTKPQGVVTVENYETGERMNLEKNEPIPEGFYKVGVVNAPVLEERQRSEEIRLDVGNIDGKIDNLDREIGKLSKFDLLPQAQEGVVKTAQDKLRMMREEKAELVRQKEEAIKRMSGRKSPVDIGGGYERGVPFKPTGKPPVFSDGTIVPKEDWRRRAVELGYAPVVGDEAQKVVENSGSVKKLLDMGVLKLQELFDMISGGSKKITEPPVRMKIEDTRVPKVRMKINKIPDFVKQGKK